MLAAHPILRTANIDRVVALVEGRAGVRMRKAGRGATADSEINGFWLRRMSFSWIRYGFNALVASADGMDAYHLALPMRGAMRLIAEERRSLIRPGQGAILSPGAVLAFALPQGVERVQLRVSAEAMARYFVLMTGKVAPYPLPFDPILSCEQPGTRHLLRHILVTLSRIDAGDLGAAPSDAWDEIESSILSALLLSLPYDDWAGIVAPLAPSPRSVHRTVDYIHANAHRGVTLENLVAVSGVAGRTLFKHFRAFRGVGPMAYLRRVRLERARADLVSAEPADSVTSVALRWSFHELGRFATAYKRVYGERPSQTLRKAGVRRL